MTSIRQAKRAVTPYRRWGKLLKEYERHKAWVTRAEMILAQCESPHEVADLLWSALSARTIKKKRH